jgi:hypothetical protein
LWFPCSTRILVLLKPCLLIVPANRSFWSVIIPVSFRRHSLRAQVGPANEKPSGLPGLG